jgi:acyl-[acyl-carrier-protein] desaturase
MADATALDSSGLEEAYYHLYREFFDQAEKKRRWSLREDIPWHRVNRALDPAVADVVESFCAVELYLPDYVAKILPMVRGSHGRAWFHANWGYEESKHSLALGDWLLRSGHRTDEQMADLEHQVFTHEWGLPRDSPLGMVLYAMVQELATWLNYRNLRRRAEEGGDPALSKLLGYICVDERAHHAFYLKVAKLYLERDRAGTLEELRRVLGTFAMPALGMLADGRRRAAAIQSLGLFDEEIFYKDVVQPLLASLGVSWAEYRQRDPGRRSATTTGRR